MKSQVAGKNILIYSVGEDVEHAARLVRDGANVKLFSPWATSSPKFEDYAIGLNFDGVEKSLYFFDDVEWADMICFFDVGQGDLCEFLKKTTKLPIFGAGLGDKLENHREKTRQIQKSIGLPVQNTNVIKGVEHLKSYLKTNKNKFVKLDIFRGDIESFAAKDYRDVELYLEEIEVMLGAFNDQYSFVVEDFIDGLEPGFDLYFDGNNFVKPMLWGFEESKAAYIGKYDDKLPPPLQLLADKLTPVLRKLDWRGACSTEVRITEGGKETYLIDICARYPYPLSEAFTESIKNYGDVIWNIANKKPVQLDVMAKYVAALPLSTSHAKDYWVKLQFDPKLRKYVKMYKAAKRGEEYFGIKGEPVVYVLCVYGDEPKKMFEALKKLVDEVDAFNLEKDVVAGFERLEEKISLCSKYGLGKF